MLHQQYRRLCRILVDVDEWGQVDVLNLLLRYARTMLPRPIEASPEELDRDVKFLLTSAEPLFQSRNPAVSGRCAMFIFLLMLACSIIGSTRCYSCFLLCRAVFLSSTNRATTAPASTHFKGSRTCCYRLCACYLTSHTGIILRGTMTIS
jgi:hypothetical protein